MALHIAYPGSMQDAPYIQTTKAHGPFIQQLLRSLSRRKLNQNYRARVRIRKESSVHFFPFATKVKIFLYLLLSLRQYSHLKLTG